MMVLPLGVERSRAGWCVSDPGCCLSCAFSPLTLWGMPVLGEGFARKVVMHGRDRHRHIDAPATPANDLVGGSPQRF